MTSQSHRSWVRTLLVVLAVMLAVPAYAHNNAVVHPEITDAALRLLRLEDMAATGISNPVDPNASCDVDSDGVDDCFYQDLWKLENRGDLSRAPAANDWTSPDNYDAAYQAGDTDIILGAVIEDGWSAGTIFFVLNHFFHGRSNQGLTNELIPIPFNSSRDRAEVLFEFGLKLRDYTPESQDRSWIYLGRFLHHIEDMSSPAHVHNDKHPPLVDDDDYEGLYIPEFMWGNGNLALRNTVRSATPAIVVNSPNQIWPPTPAGGGPPSSGTLAGFVYNTTNYMAVLEFPLVFDAPDPTGELQEMFPDDLNGLRYDDGGVLLDAFWVIDGIGQYYYKQWWSATDNWWPDAVADEDGSSPQPDGVLAPYYIETLRENDANIIPPYIRDVYADPWADPGNAVRLNSTCNGGINNSFSCYGDAECPGGTCDGASFVELQAGVLLTPPVQYTAGAARWWYDIANLPPYLEKVEVTQPDAAPMKYNAEWTYTPEPDVRVLPEIGAVPNTYELIQVVKSRAFTHDPLARNYINNENNLTIKLSFNEPIWSITELKLLDTAGAEVLDVKDAILTQPGNNTAVRTNEDKEWTYVLETSKLTGLNGELILMVKAKDKNNHLGGEGGELDQSPATPAKRDISGGWDPLNYPWHTDASNPAFTYDYLDGDRNHRLLFDSEDPQATIGVAP